MDIPVQFRMRRQNGQTATRKKEEEKEVEPVCQTHPERKTQGSELTELGWVHIVCLSTVSRHVWPRQAGTMDVADPARQATSA